MEALRRCGQDVIPFALEPFVPRSRYAAALQYRYPVGPLISRVNRALVDAVLAHKPDVVWFDKPVLFHARTIEKVKLTGTKLVCYNQDNPFGPRQDGNWRQFLNIFKLFDLHCVFRDTDVVRYTKWKLPLIKIGLSYDPQQHFPQPETWSANAETRYVAYTGSPLEDRASFLQTLAEQYQLPVSVAGPRWKDVWSSGSLAGLVYGGMMKDDAYREAMWRARINLAFITHLNEEDVAHKSFEITACGKFLLAERSEGHASCFVEGKEAEFFSSVEECAQKARYYLEHPVERNLIAAGGLARSVSSGYDNDSQLARVLWKLDGI